MSAPKVITLLLIGVIGGILIAPAKGTKTRKKLSRLFDDVSNSVQDVVDVFQDGAGEREVVKNSIEMQPS